MIRTLDIFKELHEYIQENYIPEIESSSFFGAPMIVSDEADRVEKCDVCLEEMECLRLKEVRCLEDVIEEIGESFHTRLFWYIDRSGMTDVEVYKRANIDRKLFSKIRSNPAYHPGKSTVLALVIALRLNLDESKDLLCRAEYALSPSSKTDLIVQFFIERGIYDIFTINEALDQYGESVLG